jgi:outer membrane protein OmpA-like peptidoglycan-associated protein
METQEYKIANQDSWISISDMMTGLMVIFLFVAISYMLIVKKDKDKIEEIALTYNELQNDLYNELNTEFSKDLEKWNATLSRKTLSIRFEEPDVLFGVGSYKIKPKFRDILDDFFPRYIKILQSEKYKSEIEEIRIEGHTSSEWYQTASHEKAYFENMRLSQDRTRSVLEFVLSNQHVNPNFEWLKERLTANGLSSSRLIFENGVENSELSRRVEFRVKTHSEKRIFKIINGDDHEVN